MLILSRKLNESIVIDGRIIVKVLRIDKDTVKLGIQAPAELPGEERSVNVTARGSGPERGVAEKSAVGTVFGPLIPFAHPEGSCAKLSRRAEVRSAFGLSRRYMVTMIILLYFAYQCVEIGWSRAAWGKIRPKRIGE